MIQLLARHSFSFIFTQSPAVDITDTNGDFSLMSSTYEVLPLSLGAISPNQSPNKAS